MGLNISSELIESWQDSVKRQARVLTENAALSYEDLQNSIRELNQLTQLCQDAAGNKILFATKSKSDSTILWKGTIKIACVKYTDINNITDYRLLSLNEFIKVFKNFQAHMNTIEESQCSSTSSSKKSFFDSLEFDNLLKPGDSINECCICLERKPETSLPCTHCFCLPCIEQWNVNNKTCPICREELSSTDDTWVISEIPGKEEITEAIYASLMELAHDKKT